MPGPTKNQQAMLSAIKELTFEGLPPTFEELRIWLGLNNRSQVSRYLERLRSKGLVEWDRRQQRSIRVLQCDPPPLGYSDLSAGALQSIIKDASLALSYRMSSGLTTMALLEIIGELRQKPERYHTPRQHPHSLHFVEAGQGRDLDLDELALAV